ncbi:MAG: sulfatase [Planctomycetota bacterium]
MYRFASFFVIWFAPLLSVVHAASPDSSTRPNVILIFIDDMGYGDVGFNGAKGPTTPNLDRMAAEGMRFDDFYVGCAVCSGSRTALLTGTHYQRLNMRPVLFPNTSEGLHPDEVTIADMLLEAGYATTCIGKWHLGHLPPCLPTYQGFQSYYGIPYSNDMWIDPANKLAKDIVIREGLTLEQVKAGHKAKDRVPLMRNEEVIEYPVDQSTVTKRYTEEAVQYIHENKDHPFFIYLPHTMVHRPLAVSEAFENRTGELIWDAIEEVDWSVGEILKALKQAGVDERTLVIFTSDNGAAVGSSLPLRAKKGSVYDGGIREPTVMRWPGKIPAGRVCREVTASIDVLPTLATLCGGTLPEKQIDGKDIWPLMAGQKGAKSPHETYCLMHGLGTVRSGKWKYYPWREGSDKKGSAKQKNQTDRPPHQLYDTVADISETTNVAEKHPKVVARLQEAWEAHRTELRANRRPNATLIRPDGAISASRLGSNTPAKKIAPPKNPIDWSAVQIGRTYPSHSARSFVSRPFSVRCTAIGEGLRGVLVAHGGSVTGYSLYIRQGKAIFALRRSDSNLRRVEVPIGAAERYEIVATAEGNRLSIQVNERVATTQSAGLLLRHPSENVAIGFDDRMPVDPDAPQDKFNGVLSNLSVTALEPSPKP